MKYLNVGGWLRLKSNYWPSEVNSKTVSLRLKTKEAGLALGGPEFNRYVMLEVHYNNPGRRADWVDSSGLRLRYTAKLRQYDAGVIELGLEYTDKMAIPPAQPAYTLTGYCLPECTAVVTKPFIPCDSLLGNS